MAAPKRSTQYDSGFAVIDCDKRPTPSPEDDRDLAPGYCLITAQLSYGWYADPKLVIKIIGYIKREKIQSGSIEVFDIEKSYFDSGYKELKITSIDLQYPLKTGLM